MGLAEALTKEKANYLWKQLQETLESIDAQLEQINKIAKHQGVDPHELRDMVGKFLATDLLCARAQVLHALVFVDFIGAFNEEQDG